MRNDNTIDAFFALIRGGLWEHDVNLSSYEDIDLKEVYRLAEEQSLLGLVAAGLEHATDVKLPKEEVLLFVGQALRLEHHNMAMNSFIAKLVNMMRKAGIYTLLVKGQSVAQNYERPLWRSCGDVDFLLGDENYWKAKELLISLASSSEPESLRAKELPLTIEEWVVELHGQLYCGLSHCIDKELDSIYIDTFINGNIRSCEIEKTQVFLLNVENDVFYVFSHIIQHFFKGGIGLRQVCDWCRLLWVYKGSLDLKKLYTHLQNARLITEWKAFGAFVMENIGMPVETIPFYSNDAKWKRKASRIKRFIMKSGNFGHNRDMSYYRKYPYVVRKSISLWRRTKDAIHHFGIFPIDSLIFFPHLLVNGLRSAANGE